jgi:cardiolipin synthase
MTALTHANQLTILRMLLIPVFALFVIYDYMGWALCIFLIAALTDALDGLLARRSGQKTTLGAWLDPVADKLLVATMFIVLTLPLAHLVAKIPVWLTVLVLSRDIGIVATVAIVNLAIGRRTFRPSVFGKIATATFLVTGVVTLAVNAVGVCTWIVPLLAYTCLALTVISGLHYALFASRLTSEPSQPQPAAKSVH